MNASEQHRIIRRHYGLTRVITDAELQTEIANLKRKGAAGTLDDRQAQLAAALDLFRSSNVSANGKQRPLCVRAMGCYCAGHARGNAANEPCDTREDANEQSTAETTEPTTEQVYSALKQAIQEVCDEDAQNDISAAYRRIMRERGFVDGNEE